MKYGTHENIDNEDNDNELYEQDKLRLNEGKLCKNVFERKLKIIFDIKRPNGMNHIRDNKLTTISERNVLYDILNLSKHTKNGNTHYSPILHGCMNTHKGREKCNDFRI